MTLQEQPEGEEDEVQSELKGKQNELQAVVSECSYVAVVHISRAIIIRAQVCVLFVQHMFMCRNKNKILVQQT